MNKNKQLINLIDVVKFLFDKKIIKKVSIVYDVIKTFFFKKKIKK